MSPWEIDLECRNSCPFNRMQAAGGSRYVLETDFNKEIVAYDPQEVVTGI